MTIEQDFTNTLMQYMEETFESKHHGIFLDRGTSLFETLETISAREASIPVCIPPRGPERKTVAT